MTIKNQIAAVKDQLKIDTISRDAILNAYHIQDASKLNTDAFRMFDFYDQKVKSHTQYIKILEQRLAIS